MGTRVIYKNPAHDLRSDTVEVRSILPARVLPVGQAKIGLVDEGAGFERVLRIFLSHRPSRQLPQLRIDQWREFFRRRGISLVPRLQQDGDFLSAKVWRALRCHEGSLPILRSVSRIY